MSIHGPPQDDEVLAAVASVVNRYEKGKGIEALKASMWKKETTQEVENQVS